MAYAVLLTADAERDLEGLHDYLFEHESPARANHVLDRIEKTLERLCRFPERGAYPGELVALGIREYRQILFKPCRLIYRIADDRVYVLLVADGRRDMQTLLQHRLLSAP